MNTNPLFPLLQSALEVHEANPTQRNWGRANALSFARGQWDHEGGNLPRIAASVRSELLRGDLDPDYAQGVREAADSIEWM